MDLSDDDSDFSGPSASEALLFLTLPASAAPLSSVLMPRRHRERILEITKTVTVTEVVNNSPRCHPGTCEVTVTNVDSGNGHPVSVNISHLHEKIEEDGSTGRISPVVHVKEFIKDESSSNTIERITSSTERILKVETEGDVTFGQRGDNIIDINFTHPLTQKEMGEMRQPEKTLYYHSYEKETTNIQNDLMSPDSAVSDSPKRYMRSDDSDSDSGSLVIHSPVGRADSGVSSTAHRGLNGKNLSISVGSSEEDDLRYEGPEKSPQPPSGTRLPVYIVTAKSETPNSERSQSTTTLFADIDSGTTLPIAQGTSVTKIGGEELEKKSLSMTSLEKEDERKKILVVTNVASTMAEEIVETAEEEAAHEADNSKELSDSLSNKPKHTMEVDFTPTTPKENGAPPKPPRRAKYATNQIIEHVQHYECPLDELSEGPIMTSTPMNTLERPPRKNTGQSTSNDETPILTPRKFSKPPALPSLAPETSEQPIASPRRSPSSPIIVVDQDRKSSMDLLVPPKQPRRKSTVTDIDWFAAFNMKEPTAPRSPRSPLPIDALREAENMVIERKRPHQPVVPLSPSKIDLDDVFACKAEKKEKEEKCSCNACVLMNMSDEEIKQLVASKRSQTTVEHPPAIQVVSRSEQKKYTASDISLEEVFSPPTVKQVAEGTEEPTEHQAIVHEAAHFSRSEHKEEVITISHPSVKEEVEEKSSTEGFAQESDALACSSSIISTNADRLSPISQFISSRSAQLAQTLNDPSPAFENPTEEKKEVVDTEWLTQLLTEPPNEEELIESVNHLHDVVIATNGKDLIEETDKEEKENQPVEEALPSTVDIEDTPQASTSKAVIQNDSCEEVKTTERNASNISQDVGYASQDVSKSEEEFEKETPSQETHVDLDEVFRPMSQANTQTMEVPADVNVKIEEESGDPLYVIPSTKYEPSVILKPRDLDEEAKSPAKLRTFDFSPAEVEEYAGTLEEVAEDQDTKKSKQNRSTKEAADHSWLEDIVNSSSSFVEPQDTKRTEELLDSKENQDTALDKRISINDIFSPEDTIRTEELCSEENKPERSQQIGEAIRESEEQAEDEKNLREEKTTISFDWIEEMIEDVRKEVLKQNEEATASSLEKVDVPPVDNILKLVFGTPCISMCSGQQCGCSACALSKLSNGELERFWQKLKERSERAIPSNLGTGSETIIKNDDVIEASTTTEGISMDIIFGGQTSSTTEREEIEVPSSYVGQSSSIVTGAQERGSEVPSTERFEESVAHSETTADSWIRSVIRNDTEYTAEPFEDSFEASYLASIRKDTSTSNDPSTSYNNFYREDVISVKTDRTAAARRHVDEYYDDPDEVSEEINVEELVDNILSSSLNEAAFVAATKGKKPDESRHTDTSVDRKPGEPPIMYLATAASDTRMESILPLSTPTSSTTEQSFEERVTKENFVSEASVTLNDDQDDYIIRLVFANNKTAEDQSNSTVVTESEIASPESDELREIVKETSVSSQRITLTRESSSSKYDEEILEVEVSPEHFVIKGNYSVVINKTDPLGVLLSELQADTAALDFALTPKLRRLLMQCLREKVRPNEGKSLSSRARSLVTRRDPAYDVFYQMLSNKYSPDNNTGNINFCTAENNICKDLLDEKFRENPEVFRPNVDHVTHYAPPGGYPEVKVSLAKYLKEEYSADVDDSLLALLPSGNATYDMVCHCLFDSDDVLLTTGPGYSRNFINVSERAQCRLETVPLDLSSPCLSLEDFELSWKTQTEKGDNVRAVILINPHNPLGIVFPTEDIKKLAEWTAEKNLWLIVDESFAQCVHDYNTLFESFITYQMSLRTKSLWFWSLSKDFGLPGVKLSVAQTNDKDLHQALCQLELTLPVSSLAQDFVVNFLSDREWLEHFKREKKRRLRAHYEFAADNLKSLGLPFQRATAGIFVFVDFREKMSSQNEAGEDQLWRSLTSKGIFVTPGSHTKSPQPGWMRLVFACDKEQVQEGFRRLHEFFNSGRELRELSY